MKKSSRIFLTGFIILLVLGGCGTNLFSPFHNPDSDTSLDSLLWDGKAAMEEMDYEKAEEYYRKAMESYPDSGDARLGHAAAYIALKNINTLDLFNDLDLENESLSDTDSLFPREKCAQYHDGASVVDADLTPIISGNCDLPLSDGETNLNLAFTSILLGALQIFDINGDGNFQQSYEILYLGRDLNVHGFELFAGGTLSGADKTAIVNNLNQRIDDTRYFINKSTTAINYAIKALELDSEEPEMLDEINSIANTVASLIEHYKYMDGEDNDGDWVDTDIDAVPDPLTWSDSNGNGIIEDPLGNPWDQSAVEALTLPLDATWYLDNGGEWQSGDWGVDEEKIDGLDNDSDGTVDEDSGGYI